MSVVRVEGGLAFLQRSEVNNGTRELVGHDLGKHNAPLSAGQTRMGSHSTLKHAQKEYIALHAGSKKKLDVFTGELLHGDVVLSSEEQRQNPRRFKTT